MSGTRGREEGREKRQEGRRWWWSGKEKNWRCEMRDRGPGPGGQQDPALQAHQALASH